MKHKILLHPLWYRPSFFIEDAPEIEFGTIGELGSLNEDYILTCIQDMHKVMRDGWCYEKRYRATKKLPDGTWDPKSTEEYLVESDHADINSGEYCSVSLYKDKCIVYDGFHKTETEVDPQAFYQMMCDWEKAILRWREERIEMMIEEKKKPYFREYLMKMSLDYLEQMLEREREIVREEAEKRGETAEELHKKLKTEVLERIIEHEKKKGEIEYREQENWKKEKEKLIDEYLGIEDN
jgi:hypothetical protein